MSELGLKPGWSESGVCKPKQDTIHLIWQLVLGGDQVSIPIPLLVIGANSLISLTFTSHSCFPLVVLWVSTLVKKTELSHTLSPAEIPQNEGDDRDVEWGATARHPRKTGISDGGGIGNDHSFFIYILICFQDISSFQTFLPLQHPFPYILKLHQFFRAHSDVITNTGPTSSVSGYG